MKKQHNYISEESRQKAVDSLPTPFYLYDEKSLRQKCRDFLDAFSWCPDFREYFAVKATPTPKIIDIIVSEGLGLDCSTMTELCLAEKMNIRGKDIMFTSSNTTAEDFKKALDLGVYLNLDNAEDIHTLEQVIENDQWPEVVCFRYNPGPERVVGNRFIGQPAESKFGSSQQDIIDAINYLLKRGVSRFGLHTMVASNQLESEVFGDTARMMFDLATYVELKTGATIDFINLGGGVGVDYEPEQKSVDLLALSEDIKQSYFSYLTNTGRKSIGLFLECGRYITASHALLLTKVNSVKNSYKKFVAVDASMADFMRPGMYGAYHHISVLGKDDQSHRELYDVVGGLCENNDKFAIDRYLPQIEAGDYIVIYDVGAHGRAMGFNYNGKLRAAEYLLTAQGDIKKIRRAEVIEDYFSTLIF